MTGLLPNPPQDLPHSPTQLAKPQEQDSALTAQIEQAVSAAEEGKFASDQHVAAMRARRRKQ